MPNAVASRHAPCARSVDAGPASTHGADPPTRSLGRTLRRVLNLPVDAREAEPVALLGGATIGAGMAWAINGGAMVFPGTVVGITLATISLMVSRAVGAESRDHQARLRFLLRYPGTRSVLENSLTDRDDVAAVSRVFERSRRRLDKTVSAFRDHCLRRGTPFSQLMGNALGEFYLTHCALHDACVVINDETSCYYIAAIRPEKADQIMKQVTAPRSGRSKDAAISAIFRNEGATFMRADIVNENLMQALSYQTEALGEEWRIMSTNVASSACALPLHDALGTAASIMPEQYTQTRHLRRDRTRPATECQPVRVPMARTPPVRMDVIHGVTMAEQWRLLPRNGVTQRHIRTISADLAKGRLHGHPVTVGTLKCTASDLNMEGLPGRGLWRLLHRRMADGIELIGIADYHGKGRKPLVWWTG